jgi:hypothetical protein
MRILGLAKNGKAAPNLRGPCFHLELGRATPATPSSSLVMADPNKLRFFQFDCQIGELAVSELRRFKSSFSIK